MNKLKILFVFLLLGLILSPTKEDNCMAGFFKKKYIENQPGQDLPVVTVPGKIVFQSNRGGTLSEILVLENGQIRKVASDEKTTADLPKGLPAMFGSALAGLTEPKWSAAGLRILTVGDGKISILDSNGVVLERVKTSKYAHQAIWDAAGKGIYFTVTDKAPEGGGSYNIYHLDLESSVEHRITNLSPLPGTRGILSLTVSPDGKRIAFTGAGLPNVDGISIWLVNSDGSDLKLLVKYSTDPAWSPDGTKLVYASNYLSSGVKISEYDEIFILDFVSMQTQQVTYNNWTDRHPIFSPDGKQIAYKSARHVDIADGAELFVINIDGTDEARLTPPQRNPKYPPDSINGWATDEYPDWHA
ncbi:MAG TPA: hypothetical protein PKL97_07710 [Candidatus Omnitrophota bacterium]|nr:hypothetical protein [Candidatus Omnitrophota bacterium]